MKRPSLISMIIIAVMAIAVVGIVILIVQAAIGGNNTIVQAQGNNSSISISSIEGDTNCTIERDGRRVNNSSELHKDKNVDNFVFESFEVSSINNITTITFEIYNTSDKEEKLGKYELKVLDDTYSIVGTINDEIDSINANSRKKVSIKVNGDIANLFDIQVNKTVVVNV